MRQISERADESEGLRFESPSAFPSGITADSVTAVRRSTFQSLSAGQIDSALSSVATFVAGLYAVRAFEASLLGAYVVMFTAWNLARSLSSELIFVPSEVVAVGRSSRHRISILDSSLRRGLLISLIGAFGVFAAKFIIVGDAGAESALALALTAAAVTVLAPLQEHWRRMFHISENSWRAAITSTLHLVATVGAILVLDRLGHVAWIPLGSLAVGFALSSAVAWALTRPVRPDRDSTPGPPTWPELIGIGKWLLVANTSAMGSDFLLAVIVNAAIGAEMLGYAEGARIVARPVVILGVGLAAVLGPRSTRAGIERDASHARWARRVFWVVSTAAGVAYLAVVGFDWPLNPLPDLVPTAYAVAGLVPLATVGALVYNFAMPWWFEALGGRRQRDIAWSETAGGIVKVLTGLLASVLQAFTLPAGWLVAWVVRGIGLGVSSARMFRRDPGGAQETPGTVPAVYD